MANQFSRRGPPDRIKHGHDESTKDKIRAEVLSKRLEKYAKARGKQIAKHHMEPAQVQAAKVLIERGKPALQAIEQTIHNPLDQMSEDETLTLIQALITSNPGLIQKLGIGLRPVQDASESVVDPQQTQCSNGNTA